ncbi:MAG: bacillithiol biosynthesis cysteine-adding enzyme BshC [Bacteroidia bacterium]|nr:bacillithiol biosynthesis cysteine-adding enzyme BshC [Bacteroidia bacterium]
MNLYKLNLADIPQLSSRDLAYVNEIAALRPFYKYPVQIDSFEDIIKHKSKERFDRQLLEKTLKQQYSSISTSKSVEDNIAFISDKNTYTVVTAHQPSLMTGPAYYFYKIFSVINLANQLSKKLSNYRVIPIFILGGEDHDFEEINHFSLYGKRFSWESDQKGSVGKFKLDAGFDAMLNDFFTVLGSSEASMEFKQEVQKFRDNSQTYGQFAFQLTNYLFKDLGLVVLDMSAPSLKAAFKSYILEEVIETPSYSHVENAQGALRKIKLKPQATAREINFFYTGDGGRNRLIKENGHYAVTNTEISFTQEELLSAITNRPEDFSPNVVMRPIFQESILPNLAYVGGGGEIAYWLERKSQFEHFNLNFPMLIRRNSGMVIDKGSLKKMSKLELSLHDLFAPEDFVINAFLSRKDQKNLDFDTELGSIDQVFQSIAEKASQFDATLKPKVLSEGKKIFKQTQQLASRVKRAAKQNEEVSISQIRNIKAKLFPGQGLQERKESFLGMYLKYGPEIFETLVPYFNPLEKSMVVMEE